MVHGGLEACSERVQQQHQFKGLRAHRLYHTANMSIFDFLIDAKVKKKNKKNTTTHISHQRTGCSLEVEDHGWLSAEQSILYQSFNHVQVCLTLSALRRKISK